MRIPTTSTIQSIAALAVLLAASLATSPSRAVFIGNSQGGADFPAGAISFADEVVAYAPFIQNNEPTPANMNSTKMLGVPDYVSGGACSNPATCTFASLGVGGSATLRFVDNVLTGSGTPDNDLWVFEVGPDVEDTFVEISGDGASWFALGKVFGSTAAIDIDQFGFGTASSFRYVRLTDDPNADDQAGSSVGADIDAVGAISTRFVPEPGTLPLAVAALLAAQFRRRARATATVQ